MIEECLRAKPKQRPQSSTALRERLDRGLGRPDPEQRKDEIARWLESAKIVEVEESRTIMARAARRPRSRVAKRRTGRFATALAAGIAAALLGVFATDVVRFSRAAAVAVVSALETPKPGTPAAAPAPPPATTRRSSRR